MRQNLKRPNLTEKEAKIDQTGSQLTQMEYIFITKNEEAKTTKTDQD